MVHAGLWHDGWHFRCQDHANGRYVACSNPLSINYQLVHYVVCCWHFVCFMLFRFCRRWYPCGRYDCSIWGTVWARPVWHFPRTLDEWGRSDNYLFQHNDGTVPHHSIERADAVGFDAGRSHSLWRNGWVFTITLTWNWGLNPLPPLFSRWFHANSSSR